MKNTLNEKKNYLTEKVMTFLLVIVGSTSPVFADISNIGANIGNWGTEQIGYLGLLVVAFIGLNYLVKKAWPQFGVFFILGGLLLYIIKNPGQVEGIGAIVFKIFTR